MGRDFAIGSCIAPQAKMAFLLPCLFSFFSPVFYSFLSLPKPKNMSECPVCPSADQDQQRGGKEKASLVWGLFPAPCSWDLLSHRDFLSGPAWGVTQPKLTGTEQTSELCGGLGRSLLMPSPGRTCSRALQAEGQYCTVTLSDRNHLFGSPHPLPATTSASPGAK